MEVKLSDLRIIFNKILDHLEKNGVTSIELEEDYYWEIPKNQVYNMHKDPKKLSIGQLYEDMEFLNNILKGRDEPIGYGLVWISSILRYIGEGNMA